MWWLCKVTYHTYIQNPELFTDYTRSIIKSKSANQRTWSESLKSIVLMISYAFLRRLQPSSKISKSCMSRNEDAILRCFENDRLASAFKTPDKMLMSSIAPATGFYVISSWPSATYGRNFTQVEIQWGKLYKTVDVLDCRLFKVATVCCLKLKNLNKGRLSTRVTVISSQPTSQTWFISQTSWERSWTPIITGWVIPLCIRKYGFIFRHYHRYIHHIIIVQKLAISFWNIVKHKPKWVLKYDIVIRYCKCCKKSDYHWQRREKLGVLTYAKELVNVDDNVSEYVRVFVHVEPALLCDARVQLKSYNISNCTIRL